MHTTTSTTTIYQDNANVILPITVNSHDMESIKRVAVTLCPLLEIPMLKKSLSDASSSSCGSRSSGATLSRTHSSTFHDDDDGNSSENGCDDRHDATTTATLASSRWDATPCTTKIATYSVDSDDDNDDDDAIMDHLVVNPLSGGLSNQLFVVSNPSTERSVLVRIHPDDHPPHTGNDKHTTAPFCIVNRQVENQLVAWLSSHQAAPTFYGRFENGRVEEFYLHAQPLRYSEMQCYEGQIATLMARLHAFNPPAAILPPGKQKATSNNGQIWSRMQEWLTYARKTTTTMPSDHVEFLSLLEAEFHWLHDQFNTKRQLERLSAPSSSAEQQYSIHFCSEVVLTHMDCQSLNLLKCRSRHGPSSNNNNNNCLKLIDFEYAGWNPRGMDIANTFCEHANMNELQADFHHDYPSSNTQATFLQAYLDHTSTTAPAALPWTETLCSALCHELGRYAAVSHLQWAIWSVAQISLSEIEFDYMAYAQHRMEGYKIFKQMYFCE